MENEETTEEPTLQDCMARLEEIGTRLTALETPADADNEEDKGLEEDPEVVATDPESQPAEPEKVEVDEEKKIELAARRGAEMAIKAFSAKLGITKLGKPGAASQSKPTTKHFAEFVADEALANHDGDQVKATAHILSNKAKFGDAWKAYESQRTVKTA